MLYWNSTAHGNIRKAIVVSWSCGYSTEHKRSNNLFTLTPLDSHDCFLSSFHLSLSFLPNTLILLFPTFPRSDHSGHTQGHLMAEVRIPLLPSLFNSFHLQASINIYLRLHYITQRECDLSSRTHPQMQRRTEITKKTGSSSSDCMTGCGPLDKTTVQDEGKAKTAGRGATITYKNTWRSRRVFASYSTQPWLSLQVSTDEGSKWYRRYQITSSKQK